MDTTQLQLEIKKRFRLLVTVNGGPSACERILGFPQSHLCEATSPHHLDRMPRADHISLLEAACGQLIMTSFMADLQGYDIELREHKPVDLATALATMLKYMGLASADAALMLGKKCIDETTRKRAIQEMFEAKDALESLIMAMRDA